MMTWRARLVGAVAIVLALVGSYGLGRYSRPAVVSDQKTAASSSQSKSATTAVVAQLAEAHAEKDTKGVATAGTDTSTRTIIKWLPSVPAKDGCPAIPAHVEQETTTETHATTTRTKESHASSEKASKLDAKSTKDEVASAQSTIVTLHTEKREQSRLSLTALVGVQKGGERLLDAVPSPVVVGLGADVRLIGPISIGGQVTSSKAGFITLRFDL